MPWRRSKFHSWHVRAPISPSGHSSAPYPSPPPSHLPSQLSPGLTLLRCDDGGDGDDYQHAEGRDAVQRLSARVEAHEGEWAFCGWDSCTGKGSCTSGGSCTGRGSCAMGHASEQVGLGSYLRVSQHQIKVRHGVMVRVSQHALSEPATSVEKKTGLHLAHWRPPQLSAPSASQSRPAAPHSRHAAAHSRPEASHTGPAARCSLLERHPAVGWSVAARVRAEEPHLSWYPLGPRYLLACSGGMFLC